MCKQACLVIPLFLVPELTRKNVLLKLGGDSGIMKGWKAFILAHGLKQQRRVLTLRSIPWVCTFMSRCSGCCLLPVPVTSEPPDAFVDFFFLSVSYSRHFLWHFSEILSH